MNESWILYLRQILYLKAALYRYRYLTINLQTLLIIGQRMNDGNCTTSVLHSLLGKENIRTHILLIRFGLFDLLISILLVLDKMKQINHESIFKLASYILCSHNLCDREKKKNGNDRFRHHLKQLWINSVYIDKLVFVGAHTKIVYILKLPIYSLEQQENTIEVYRIDKLPC